MQATDLSIADPSGRRAVRSKGLDAGHPAVVLIEGASLRLATCDKALAFFPGGGDYGHPQDARHRIAKTVADFLDG